MKHNLRNAKMTRKYQKLTSRSSRNYHLASAFRLVLYISCFLFLLPHQACVAFQSRNYYSTIAASTKRANKVRQSTTSSHSILFSSGFSEASEAPTTTELSGLKVAIAGAGPTGLLLAHLLLQKGAEVSIYESRPDPRSNTRAALAGFAYALGVGIRGRTAIRTADDRLWQAVKQWGNECDRFRLHVGPLNIKLRDSGKTREHMKNNATDPSLLLFQADLCVALIEELERRYGEKCDLNFKSRVVDCDLSRKTITVDMNKTSTTTQSYDLLVGCDGVNSLVRNAIKEASSAFTADKQTLPGEFKVARLDAVPPKLDSNSVALLVPKKGSSTAFLEPTVNGTCCLLFTGRGGKDSQILSPNKESEDENKTAALAETLRESFPLFEGADLYDVAEQLISQKPGTASSVSCNVYHYLSSVALAGDAAHATGGVTGQGVNSALVDSAVLSECLLREFNSTYKEQSLAAALLAYSKRQVPEGKALYDLSFGPKPTGFKAIVYSLRRIRDFIFQGHFGIGKKPLQTTLTTTLQPFSSVRRKMDYFYDEPFPSAASFNNSIAAIYKKEETTSKVQEARRV